MTTTIPTTLTEYQEFVRTEALKVQVDMGWPDEKLNATLRALGLPEKLNFYVPVEVTGKMVVVINVTDAMTEDEARAKVAGMSSEELRTQVRNFANVGNFTQLSGEVTTIPDTFAVGDPDFTLSNSSIYASMQTREERRQCENYRANSSAYCTLRRGHDNDHHVAGNGSSIIAVWPVSA